MPDKLRRDVSMSEAEMVESPTARRRRGLSLQRHFTNGRVSPYEEVQWERRSALIQNEKGETIFEQKEVEVPRDWSQTATNIVASKYLHGKLGSAERENSVRGLVGRVVETMRDWGMADGYFKTDEDARIFHDELVHLLITQKAAFNSPVWFNCGVHRLEPEAAGANWYWDQQRQQPAFGAVGYHKPQCSACFINSVSDSLDSILTLAKTEGMLFKWGSGTGTNLSPIRSSQEQLSGGGTASGPLSFMRGFDAFAGVIKSGGKTRRAAKMVVLNADHPDIEEYIWCKAKEEQKAHTLVQAGYDPSLDGEAYSSIFFQNANNSVRVTDEFMQAAEADGSFELKRVAGERKGEAIKRVDAKGLLRQMAEAAWQCGDPGIQYDTTVNQWHTSKNTARINASNPCSEYMFLDDSACNLASINLMKFNGAGGFDVAAYRQVVNILITAQEIIIDNASYPTERIAQNSHDYRPLGLGYANLGALLMSNGLPYDSDGGRDYAGALTAIMCGQGYLQSARIAEALAAPGAPDGEGAFPGYARNREPMLDVIRMHRAAVNHINPKNVAEPVMAAARQCWDEALEQGSRHGYRNAQVTVLAPTGTIGFMMDCDTTGIEPDLALVKSKKLVGGGVIKIVNQSVDKALLRLGYSAQQTHDILAYVDATSTIEGAPHLKPEHLPVFDCSFKPANGTRSIHYLGHIRMMAAAQPFLSGAISKTVNLPEAATVEDVVQVYTEGWKLGLKAIAIYRDGSKKVQPLSAAAGKAVAGRSEAAPLSVPASVPTARPYRRRLPEERQSLTHKFKIGGHEGYITVGMYEDGQPGEIFVTMAKEGSTISGLMDSFATAISLALQHGVPLRLLVDKFSHTRFEPSGWSGNAEIGYAKSIMDYLFRWMGQKFLDHQPPAPKGVEDVHGDRGERQEALETVGQIPLITTSVTTAIDAPACHNCGSIMVPNGSCFKCVNCGETSGCS